MLEFIGEFWWVWIVAFAGSALFLGYSRYRASQQKDFIFIGGAAIGCLIIFFQIFGAISAILSIIGATLRILAWKITGG